jgi:hypothetical protein
MGPDLKGKPILVNFQNHNFRPRKSGDERVKPAPAELEPTGARSRHRLAPRSAD